MGIGGGEVGNKVSADAADGALPTLRSLGFMFCFLLTCLMVASCTP